jgi:N-glycosylase/DNA lyase
MQSGELNLALVENGTLSEGMEHLCQVKGIGPKVASCVLLFGFEKLDAFPVDVWIKKAIQKYFSADFTPSMLGQYAGVAQQYLFYYERYLKQ